MKTNGLSVIFRILLVLQMQCKKVQVGKDQEKAQSERDSHSKNRGGKDDVPKQMQWKDDVPTSKMNLPKCEYRHG